VSSFQDGDKLAGWWKSLHSTMRITPFKEDFLNRRLRLLFVIEHYFVLNAEENVKKYSVKCDVQFYII